MMRWEAAMTIDSRALGTANATLLDWDGAPSECQAAGPAFQARTFLVDRAFRRLRPRRLLDIGCGRGNVTAIAATHAASVVATDLSPDAVVATRTILSTHRDARVLCGDAFADRAQFPDGSFDAILLSEVLEHLDDDEGALAGCRRLLKPGGALVLTVPGDPNLWTRWDELAGHRRRYRRAELREKLARAGFRIASLTNWGFPITGWLAIRSARMRSRRAAAGRPEVPAALARVMPLASVGFKVCARVEPLFSSLDRGAGYVVAATAF
jgi:SAM-dependent methyltransferase